MTVRAYPDLVGDRRGADGATLAVLYLAALLVVPARLVFRGVPLSLTPAVLVGFAVLGVWLCAQLTTTLGMAKGRTPARTAIFAYLTVLLASYGYANARYLPADEVTAADRGLLTVLAVAGAALIVSDGVRTRERLASLLRWLVGLSAFVAVVGILQFFELNLTEYLQPPFLRYTDPNGPLDVTQERAGFLRPAGTTGHPIEFGVLCVMVLPLALHFAFQASARAVRAWPWWACCLLLGTGLMFSVSRSAVLALAVVGGVLFATWSARRRLTALAVAGGFLVLMKFLVPGLIGTVIGLFTGFSRDGSVDYRTNDYPLAMAQVERSPWLGRGFGTFYPPKHPILDNQYLGTLVETGLLGLVAFVALLVGGVYCALRVRAVAADAGERELMTALVAALLVPVVGSATYDTFAFASVTGVTLVLIGAASAAHRISRERPRSGRSDDRVAPAGERR